MTRALVVRSASTALLALLTLVGCKSAVDPDKARFGCAVDDDCGAGFVCKTQVTDAGLCFKPSECTDESCNGLDDDCDGAIDESFAGKGDSCKTSRQGPCSAGTRQCIDGEERCVGTVMPMAEVCNGADDDCDGTADDGIDLFGSNQNCGACGRTCALGTDCVVGNCRETNCSDGLDNDGDGGTDCADLSCRGLICFFTPDASFTCKAPDAGSDGGTDAGLDGGDPDGGTGDAGLDAGELDAGMSDAGLDGGELDAGTGDAGSPDAGSPDAGAPGPGCFP